MHRSITVVGIGEILWDVLDDGEKLGGAPVNFAYHVNSLGASAIPISTIGDDDRGQRALGVLKNKGLRTDAVSLDPGHPTGYVQANVDDRGVANYSFPDDVAWDHLRFNEAALSILKDVKGVCFGTLAQRTSLSRSTIHHFLGQLSDTVLKVYDVNLRQHYYDRKVIETSFEMCNVIKLSDEELQVIKKMFSLPGEERAAVSGLIGTYNLKLAVITRGESGSLLATASEISEHPGFPSQIADTIGAGDAFTAATTLGFLLGHDLDNINEHANRLAAYVCTQKGAMPPIPAEFRLA
jgi:fructokinase